jgi:hypothetical protein
VLRPERVIPKVYLHRAPVDFRSRRQGLAALVQGSLGLDPFLAFVDALLRTAKCRPQFPMKGFTDLKQARARGEFLRALVQPRSSQQRHPLRQPGSATCR